MSLVCSQCRLFFARDSCGPCHNLVDRERTARRVLGREAGVQLWGLCSSQSCGSSDFPGFGLGRGRRVVLGLYPHLRKSILSQTHNPATKKISHGMNGRFDRRTLNHSSVWAPGIPPRPPLCNKNNKRSRHPGRRLKDIHTCQRRCPGQQRARNPEQRALKARPGRPFSFFRTENIEPDFISCPRYVALPPGLGGQGTQRLRRLYGG